MFRICFHCIITYNREEDFSSMEKSQLNLFEDQESSIILPVQVNVCSVCGEDHDTVLCPVLKNLKHVHDTETISRARLTLPSNLEVRTLADGTTTVIANAKFEGGTQFGPFQAPLSLHMHPAIAFPLKVFPENVGDGYYLDTTDEELCNWMCLVAAATTSKQQNLICYDIKQSIYFTTTRDVIPGDELRVWYALYYGLKLQALPLADDISKEDEFWDFAGDEMDEEKLKPKGIAFLETLAQQLPAHTLGASGERDSWNCRLCGSEEKNVASYARHLMAHHRGGGGGNHRNVRPQCDICLKRFLSEKAVAKHKETRHYNSVILPGVPAMEVSHHGSQISMVVKHTSDENQDSNKLMDTQNKEMVSISNNVENLLLPETFNQSQKLMSLADVSSVELQNLSNFSDSNFTSKHCEEAIDSVTDVSNEEVLRDKVSVILDSSANVEVSNFEVHKDTVFVDKNFELSSTGGSASSNIQDFSDRPSKTDANFVESTDLFLKIDGAEDITSTEIILNAAPQISLNESCEKHPDVSTNLSFTSTAELFVHAEDGSILPASYSLDEAQNIKMALESGEPVAFILVNSLQNKNLSHLEENNLTDCSDSCKDMSSLLQSVKRNQPFDAGQDKACHSQDENSNKEDAKRHKKKSASPFNCDICNKSFEKSTYLYRHLRKHTGEFTCMTCLTVFARKENLQSHSCARPMVRYPCPSCGKKFSTKKYLQRHIPLHTGEFTCHNCKRQFVSRISLEAHHCSSETMDVEDVMSCFLCQRLFMSQVKLQAHLRRHYVNLQATGDISSNSSPFRRSHRPQKQHLSKNYKTLVSLKSGENSSHKDFVCEVCGATFKSCSSMKTHRYLHEERRFECEVCKKRFHRKDVLQDHLTVHQEAKLPCHICGKKYKTKKSLYVHMTTHNGSKRFTCEDCGKEFFQKGNLVKHQHTHATEREFSCQYCKKKFTSKEYFNIHVLEHTQGKIFTCDVCKKSFVKKHLLESHHQLYHSNKGFLCKFCNSVMRHRHSARRHLEMRHNDQREEWSAPGFLDCLLMELPDCLLHPAADGLPSQTQPQERQKLLQSLRDKHYRNTPLKHPALVNEDLDSTSDFLYTIVPPSDSQVDQLAQGDPLVMLQPTKQLTIFDNYASDSTPQVSSVPALMVPGMKGSEILLTMVESGVTDDSESIPSSATADAVLSLDSGTTYVMEDEAGNSSVLYYVVEAGTDVHNSDVDDILH